jgi:hypothetical protein
VDGYENREDLNTFLIYSISNSSTQGVLERKLKISSMFKYRRNFYADEYTNSYFFIGNVQETPTSTIGEIYKIVSAT